MKEFKLKKTIMESNTGIKMVLGLVEYDHKKYADIFIFYSENDEFTKMGECFFQGRVDEKITILNVLSDIVLMFKYEYISVWLYGTLEKPKIIFNPQLINREELNFRTLKEN